MKEYLLLTQSLPDGSYITSSHLNWIDRLRIKLAKRLFKSVKKVSPLVMNTTAS